MSGEVAADVPSSPPARGARLGSRLRLLSATTFAGAMLAFALPFGTVSSCEGEEVRFTGAQLAAFSVPPDESTSGTLHLEVENNVGPLAVVVLLVAALGVFCAVRGVSGGGICAAVGLIAMQLLGLAVMLLSASGGMPLEGFWIGLLSLAGAGVAHLVAAVRERQQSGRRVWRYAFVRSALTLSPTLALVGLIAVVVLAEA
jgi:hypothetical protein